MSTRSTTHFIHGSEAEPTAIVYRHSDGYPSGAGVDIYEFFADVEAQTSDTRFGDPSYLAAKYVVWLAAAFARSYDSAAQSYVPNKPLDFLSVGIVASDPGDIEYRYTIECGRFDAEGRPRVKCWERRGLWAEPTWEEVPIPLPDLV